MHVDAGSLTVGLTSADLCHTSAGDVHKSMDGVVSRWAAMPTGIMRPDFVRTMDDRIEQAYVDCIKLQGQQVSQQAGLICYKAVQDPSSCHVMQNHLA